MQYYLYVANCRDYRLRVFNKFFNQMQSIPVKAAIYRFAIEVHHHAVKSLTELSNNNIFIPSSLLYKEDTEEVFAGGVGLLTCWSVRLKVT